MSQAIALLVDAYRELNSRKMFWITLALSLLIIGAFACVGVTPAGMKILVWKLPVLPGDPRVFYKSMFTTVVIGLWLTWGAVILALVSTAGIFPDFISGGSIDLSLSKPIGRLRLFVIKYLSGLVFVAIQVTVTCTAAWLAMGLRGGMWLSGVFLAIPIVIAVFSYLYGLCVLLGVWTRSMVAALLLTLLLWFLCFIASQTEVGVLQMQLMQEQTAAMHQRQATQLEAQAARASATTASTQQSINVANLLADRDDNLRQVESASSSAKTLARFHYWIYLTKTALPKTRETTSLLDRILITDEELRAESRYNRPTQPPEMQAMSEAALQMEQALRRRPLWWVVGTSLGFELVTVSLAAWIFCRRDY